MTYVVKVKGGDKVVALVNTVEEALIAGAAQHLQVEAKGYESIVALAEAKVAANPANQTLPTPADKYVLYNSKAGNSIFCEVVRMYAPDAEGHPEWLELVNVQRHDNSFPGRADRCKVVDLTTMNPALANAMIQGQDYETFGGGNTPKLTKGLRK